jgi:hypothetical protein
METEKRCEGKSEPGLSGAGIPARRDSRAEVEAGSTTHEPGSCTASEVRKKDLIFRPSLDPPRREGIGRSASQSQGVFVRRGPRGKPLEDSPLDLEEWRRVEGADESLL